VLIHVLQDILDRTAHSNVSATMVENVTLFQDSVTVHQVILERGGYCTVIFYIFSLYPKHVQSLHNTFHYEALCGMLSN